MAFSRFLAAEEPGQRLGEFEVVVDGAVRVDVQSVLLNSFKILGIAALSESLDALFSLFLHGGKPLSGLLQNAPREVQLLPIGEMKHHVSRLTSTLRIKLDPAHLRILY